GSRAAIFLGRRGSRERADGGIARELTVSAQVGRRGIVPARGVGEFEEAHEPDSLAHRRLYEPPGTDASIDGADSEVARIVARAARPGRGPAAGRPGRRR